MHPRTQLLIPAAGMGTRLGADRPKALIELAGTPLLVRTLRRFEPLGLVDGCVIAVAAVARGRFQECLGASFPTAKITFVDGGAERQDSVANCLAALETSTEIVVIHDAARPFVPLQSIRESIAAAAEFGAATVAVPSIDTILIADDDAFLCDTPDRRTLWACQTPQTFRLDTLRRAHAAATREGFTGTDDASLVRRAGGRVKLVMGSPLNFKVTTPHDLELARCVVEGGIA
ncbi:MAG: 2-C-methyl-D-erythritol 4-phosphate cytidylyltransferase [Candidatus Hydrogenedentes bacterium]|nr:2-C-methyl-D-erythritol 4-phosphate cytidylyltransferase [Candidatus Hydrogenedentota bacterium]